MRNYYIQIHEYLEKLLYNIMEIDRRGISYKGDKLSITDICLIKALSQGPEKRMYEIIEELKIPRNAMVPLIAKLTAANYIYKKRDIRDKRVQIIGLTEKGLDALNEVTEKERQELYSLLNDFTFNEEKAILKFLVKIDMLYKKTDNK